MKRGWLGPVRLALRTRRGRRAGDPGQVLRALTRGADRGVGLRLGARKILLLTDPALVGELLVGHAAQTTKGAGAQSARGLLGNGLLTSEGSDHQRARRLVAPAFSPRRLAGYTSVFASRTTAHCETWADGSTIDVHHEMASLTLDIVGQTLLGVDLSDQASDIRTGLEKALAAFSNAGGGAGGGLGGPLRRVRSTGRPGPPPGELGRNAPVHAVVDTILAERAAHPSGDRGDVVSALLAASVEEGGLTHQEVHDNVMTLMMAGHETTANALSWALHLLGRHPAAQRKLQQEVDGLGRSAPETADLTSLPYTRAVVSEAMRLYPPAWIFGRMLTEDITFGPFQMSAGATVVAAPLLLHHDSRWFPDPAVFRPERWLDGRQQVPKYAYLPFGTGPRSCIGEQFAWAEAITILAVLATRFDFESAGTGSPEIEYRITLRPKGALPVRVSYR